MNLFTHSSYLVTTPELITMTIEMADRESNQYAEDWETTTPENQLQLALFARDSLRVLEYISNRTALNGSSLQVEVNGILKKCGEGK